MSPVQRSEDPARNLHSIWLGPTNAWRWWFDATYTEWAIGLFAFIASFIVLWWVLPTAALIVLGAAAWGRWASNAADPVRLARWLLCEPSAARRRARWVFGGLFVAFAVVIAPSPALWLLPLPWFAALPGAIYLAGPRTVKRIRPYVDGNRPIGYWLATLKAVATGPRRIRQPLADLVVDIQVVDGMSGPLADFADLTAVLAFNNSLPDRSEFIVLTYQQKTPVVEAMLFDSTRQDTRTCENVVVWMRSHGINVVVERIDRDASGVMIKAKIRAAGVPLINGYVITLNPTDGSWSQVERKDFNSRFVPTKTVQEVLADEWAVSRD